mmetsp:Transcript_44463/g.87071  ORF Transcript_44463/g.87071 Transcript_44463/m.87071 type:complete len:201 (-) Transcript_44463:473-1075(-)
MAEYSTRESVLIAAVNNTKFLGMHHRYDIVTTQIENGMAELQQMKSYLDKYHQSTCTDMEKAAAKIKPLEDISGMKKTHQSIVLLEKTIEKGSKNDIELNENVKQRITVPMDTFVKEQIQFKKKLDLDFSKLVKTLQTQTGNLQKEEASCLGDLAKLEALCQEMKDPSADTAKLGSRVTKSKTALQKKMAEVRTGSAEDN